MSLGNRPTFTGVSCLYVMYTAVSLLKGLLASPDPPPGHSVEEVCTGVALKAQTVLPLVVLLPVFVNGQWLHWLRVEGL